MQLLASPISYSEIYKYETSMTMNTLSEVQVFDNADHNTRTVDGHRTFHVMGGVQCVTLASGVQTCSCISPWIGARLCPTRGARPAVRGDECNEIGLQLNTPYKNFPRRGSQPPVPHSGATPDSTTKDYTNGKYCWKVWIHPNRY
ncbi:hypothetical protein AVEN_104452-1 [Araneus ventricosus]|uniref:Uncharacterized protein n=1 Tax=Araneus ventricosus TaxID=182803 RepID=A0A4Y2MST1_ARAVE|nr:hypothetical protein AVEN_104452-1 [Araneus ventricosus]